MSLYRFLFALGALVALGLLFFFVRDLLYGSGGLDVPSILLQVMAPAGVPAWSTSLARQGRTGLASTVLLLLIVPGLLACLVVAFLVFVGFGPHH